MILFRQGGGKVKPDGKTETVCLTFVVQANFVRRAGAG